MGVILKAENISKQYRLGLVGTGSLGHDFNRFWHRIRGKEDPYLKVGAVNDRSAKATQDYVWALRDINFEVRQGEVLGIIGKNGAGKSTLLKLLSRVTGPTTGTIKSKGRIASLLEVGTGFHPELTGRENIYLNGAILGMTKAEIASKIDEIIEFSGCELYIDTPTKRYSSGMTVRLAFAVAAHLEPDILVVDEVLAVGDAEFQRKAIGKMKEISSGEGRTVLFVSHNMASIQNLCSRAILLSNGTIDSVGDVDTIISNYLMLNRRNEDVLFKDLERSGDGLISIENYVVKDCKTNSTAEVLSGSDVEIELKYTSQMETSIANCRFSLGFKDEMGTLMFNCPSNVLDKSFAIQKQGSLVCRISRLPLKEGTYSMTVFVEHKGVIADWILEGGLLTVVAGDYYKTGILPVHRKGMLVDFDWSPKDD